MRAGRLKKTVMAMAAAAAAYAAFALPSVAAAEEFSPGVGLADPGVGMNASGYVKWEQATVAPFIDRMKAAFAWTGRRPDSHGGGPGIALKDAGVFTGTAPPYNITLRGDTVIDVYQLLVAAVYHRKMISTEMNERIQKGPEDFFKIETGPGGRSELLGRLRDTDPFRTIARFDRNIGMDLRALRRKGHMLLTRYDLSVGLDELTLDRNGWPTRLPTDLTGRKGSVSTAVLWYPKMTIDAPGSIYAGTFYLMADGEGTLSLTQRGSGGGLLDLRNVQINGPTAVKFDYTPNGDRVVLTISDSDPRGNGEYLRNIRIVHEKHMALYEAGEIFAPEYREFMQDYRVIRWMQPMEGPRNPPFFEGAFEDRPLPSHYTFNMGTNNTDRNGFPIDTIIEFANQTGTDVWITPPVNVTDEFARGMAAYVAATLDPKLRAYVELGNENWNGIFPSYGYSEQAALERWGELKVRRDPDGSLTLVQPGRFVSNQTLRDSGAGTPEALAKALGLKRAPLRAGQSWYEWGSMRATQVGRIFEDEFEKADPARAKERLYNVIGSYAAWPRGTDLLMKGTVWREEEPEAWIDPRTVFEGAAIAPYFGHYLGSRHSDLVTDWIETMGPDRAKAMALRHMTAGLDPNQPYYRITSQKVGRGGRDTGDPAFRDVEYRDDLFIDLWPLLEAWHPEFRQKYRDGTGVQEGKAFLNAREALDYLQLAEESGNTVLRVRKAGSGGGFKTVLAFRGRISQSLEELLAAGVVVPRSVDSVQAEAGRYIAGHQQYTDAHGVDLIAYEGGQHIAVGAYGPFRANLKNQPLTRLLIQLNREPEMAALYRFWFDTWKKNGGKLFAHYADIGQPSRYGDWGVMSYLGEDKEPGAHLPKLAVLREENAKGSWWRESRAPDTFLQGIVATAAEPGGTLKGTQKHDTLFANAPGSSVAGGPGDDRLSGGPKAAMLDGGDGDDTLVLSASSTAVRGGGGTNTLKAAGSLATLDLSALNASGIDVIDIRNAAKTSLRAAPADIPRLNGNGSLTIYAETADKLSLKGFTETGREMAADGHRIRYEGQHNGATLTLTVITDIAPR